MSFALPRGTRIDTRARARSCSREQAARARCPEASRIGLGRKVVIVRGYLSPGGETEVAWSLTAYLGTPVRAVDAAAIVLRAELLGAARVNQLLVPSLGTSVPSISVATGRVVRRASGPYGLEVRFAELPGELRVPTSITATPTRFELAIGAVRRIRRDFVRHIRVRTLTGYEIKKIRDHRLVGYDLLHNPESCSGSWAYELTVGFPGGVERHGGRIECTGDR